VITFNCEGCGYQVHALDLDKIPETYMCSVCEWLCEFVVDPEEISIIRKQIDDIVEKE
jgi:transcription elongation factor Elf1